MNTFVCRLIVMLGCEQNTHFIFLLVLLTVHLITLFVNNQLDTQFFFLYLFIPILYMFRATKCSSSGESIVSIRPLVYTVYDRVVCRLSLHTTRSYTVYTRGRIDTIDSPDDEHLVARNM